MPKYLITSAVESKEDLFYIRSTIILMQNHLMQRSRVEYNTYKQTEQRGFDTLVQMNQNKNKFTIIHAQAFSLQDKLSNTNGRDSVFPPTSVQRAIVTQSQQSERQLIWGEAQRESSNPTPTQSPRTEGNGGTETKGQPSLWNRGGPAVCPGSAPKNLFLPAIQQLRPC